MVRNLDVAVLRAFVAVADTGGVTRAAGYLNLTQSAVSMQLKRLEDLLGLALLDRSGRGISLTTAGEQLLGYARRMLDLNDEVFQRLTDNAFEGEITFGVPHDIVYPSIPTILRRFHAAFPRVKVQLVSSYSRLLREQFDRGECDIILTTEDHAGDNAELLAEPRLVWVGAREGQAWRQRPLPLGFENRCLFRRGVIRALNTAGIKWEMVVEAEKSRPIEASVSADLAVHVMVEGTSGERVEEIEHGGQLPDLGRIGIYLYSVDAGGNPPLAGLAAEIRRTICHECWAPLRTAS